MNKRLKNIILLVVMVFFLSGCGGTISGLNYFEFDSETGTITGYNDDGPRDVTLPSSVDGIRVTAIGKNAFRGKQLTGAHIFTGVISIGEGSFADNQLTSVTIGNSVITIGASAFEDNLLETVVLPDSVVIIGEKAFAYNRLTDAVFGNSINSMGNEAFAVNQLSSIVIPDSITSVGNDAFSGNRITSITIGPNKNYAANIVPNFGTAYNANGKQAGTYTQIDSSSWANYSLSQNYCTLE